jgi:hypothetical protein
MICYKHLNFRGSGFAININQFKILYKKRTSFLIATILIPPKTMATTIIPFHELVPGSEGVRYTNIGGYAFISVLDIIKTATKKNQKDAGEVWHNLSEALKNELVVVNFQFPGRESPQPVTFLSDALKLIMLLPGPTAPTKRIKMCEVLTGSLPGDATIRNEIKANAKSAAPTNEMARASPTDWVAESLDRMDAIERDQERKERDQELAALRTEINHTRHLRHQADARIQEANQTFREMAAYWKDVAKKEREWNNTQGKQLQECYGALMKRVRERSRSPRRAAGYQ